MNDEKEPIIYLGETLGKWRKGPVYGSQSTSLVYSSNRKSKMAKKSEKDSVMLTQSNLFSLCGPWLGNEVE